MIVRLKASKRSLGIFIIAITVCALFTGNISAQTDSAILASARKNGLEMSNWFLAQNPNMSTGYPQSCSFYGVCIFSEAIKDTSLVNAVDRRYRAYIAGGNTPAVGNVDMNVHGIVPFELYRQSNPKYAPFLTYGTRMADDEFSTAHLRPDSLSTYSRFWVDDMYMIGSLQTQAYKSTNTARYINNAARTLFRYIDSLQQPNGLFYHCPALGANWYWGRGNGWAASSMTELLLAIPAAHPLRAQIMSAYMQQMWALARCQDSSGMWHQLLDDKTTFIESSCTGMFVFALATGVDQGWLTADSFKVAAKKGWMALAGYFDPVNGLRNVCIGLSASSDRTVYTQHQQQTGDSHGTAGFIWAATAMARWLGKPLVQIGSDHPGCKLTESPKVGVDNRIFDCKGRIIHGDAKNFRNKNSRITKGVYFRNGKRFAETME